MISLIICARSSQIPDTFITNIEATIGVAHEFVIIDNSRNQYSIYEAYNLGIKRSRFSYLCFIHDDILFHSANWGAVLIKYFQNIPNLGCVGIAGATYKTKAPSAWWDAPMTEWVLYLIENAKGKTKEMKNIGWNDDERYKEVSVLDGVLLATQQSDNLKFDGSLSGFHGYDLNLSLEAKKKGLKVIVTKEILIEHFSQGTINKEWVLATHLVHQKYGDLLPLSCGDQVLTKKLEVINLERFIDQAIKLGLKNIALYYWLRFIKLKPVAKTHFRILLNLFK